MSTIEQYALQWSAQDRAYGYIRTEIVSGRMASGEAVDPSKVANLLGMSRMPVREAMFRLAAEGFLTNKQNRRMVVNSLRGEDIEELFDIRAELEALAVRKGLPKMPASTMEHLRFLSLRMRKSAGQTETWIQLHTTFHEEICAASGYSTLLADIQRLHARVQPYMRLYFTAFSRLELPGGDHSELLAALSSGDLVLAEGAMREHVWQAGRELAEFTRNLAKRSDSTHT